MSQWKNPPPLVILSGDHDFLRMRQLKEAVTVADTVGRSVEYVKGSDREALSGVLSSSGVFFPEDILVVLNDAEDVDVSLLLDHHERGSNDVVVVVHHPGKIKPGSNLATVADEIPKKYVARFEKPKPWEAHEGAVNFCVSEASQLGFSLPQRIADAIVKNVGNDLGVLSFEIDKLGHYLRAEGKTTAEPADVRGVLGAFVDLGPKPIVDALERKNAKAVSTALANMRRTHSGNLAGATLRACAFVSRAASEWLHVAALLDEGASQEEILSRTGKHRFLLREVLLPAAKRWGQGGLVSLIRSVARVERSVRSGHTHPWVELECALLEAFDERSNAG